MFASKRNLQTSSFLASNCLFHSIQFGNICYIAMVPWPQTTDGDKALNSLKRNKINQCLKRQQITQPSSITNIFSFPVSPQYKHCGVFIYIQCKEQYHRYNWNASGERINLKHLFLNTFQCGTMILSSHQWCGRGSSSTHLHSTWKTILNSL